MGRNPIRRVGPEGKKSVGAAGRKENTKCAACGYAGRMPNPSALREVARVRVIYGDTDQMGMVYYGNYLRYFEIARTEFLRQGGASARFEYEIRRAPDGELLVEGHTVHACVDATGKVARLPRSLRDALSA